MMGQTKENTFFDRHPVTLHRDFPFWQSSLISVMVLMGLILVVYQLKIPNPNMILIVGLVICSSLFGFSGGVPAAVVMLGYTLFFFSEEGSLFEFTLENLKKVWVSLFGITSDMVFVCVLKKQEQEAYREVRKLTEQLKNENRKLQEMSMHDMLTGIGNRFALRQMFDLYQNQHMFVMMLDIDDFKTVNDTFGHACGDRLLAATGKLLADIFGKENCYRYGGDEFLVLAAGNPDTVYQDRVRQVMENRPSIEVEGKNVEARYSIGYLTGRSEDARDLRSMLSQADDRLYEAKRRGKNQIVGA